MAKKRKQNKVAWRRRGAEFEEAAQRVHRAANQDRRTGAGKLSALADDQLFSLEPGAAGGGKLASARKRRSAADEPPKQLWVDRVVAPNPHIDTVVKPAVSSSKPGAPSRGTLLVREKLGKIQKASARTRAKELEARAKAEKAARQREKQAGRVGNLLAEISKEDKAREHKRQEEAEWEAARPKKLGPRRYEAKRPDVLLSDEQPAALRLVRQEKSLLDDRFESMQARNLVEVRERRAAGESRRHRRTVLRESAKDTKYKSPFGIPGPKPAWL